MFSWWNSLEIVSRISTISNFAIAFLGVWVFVISRRESTLTDRQTTEANLTRDALISGNNLATEEAKRDAAKATEGLALANERAAKLEKEATTARLELEKIKERQAPRTINPAQEAAILSKLKGLARVHICFEIDTGSDDALAFANVIGNILAKAGYEPLPICRPMTGNVSRDITVSPKDAPEAQRILDSFLHAGLRATNIRSGSHLYLPGYTQTEPPDTITLTIGKRSAE